MRLTLLGKEFPPQLSGIGDYTDHLSGELARRGHQVTVVTSHPAERRDGVDIREIAAPWDTDGFDRIVAAVAGTRPAVILLQYNPFSMGKRGVPLGAARFARALARVAPLVVVFHELWFPWGREGARGVVWAVTQRVEATRIARIARACVVTTEQRERALRPLAKKVWRIPVGANVVPVPEGEDPRALLGIPPDAFVIAHLGSTGPGRDLGPAVQALGRLHAAGIDARLLLAGNTGPHPRAEGIHTTGVVPRDALSRALQAADVYLHPDHAGPSAGRRTTIAAALAHALPVVSYRGPQAAPQLVDGESVVLVDARADAIASVMATLAAEPDRRRAIGASGRRIFDENFSWTRIGDGFESVLTDITA